MNALLQALLTLSSSLIYCCGNELIVQTLRLPDKNGSGLSNTCLDLPALTSLWLTRLSTSQPLDIL
jgi:hypothetical protein